MSSLAAAIFLAFAASDGRPLNWTEDLASACGTARREDKLILLRQIVCECDGRGCAFDETARNPSWLKDETAFRRVRHSFVPAVTHVAPGKEMEGLFHPAYAPADYRRGTSRVRTFFLTPTRHIVHRLDLCPHADDVDAELQFALRVGRSCYGADGVPLPGCHDRMFALHLEHSLKPESCHAKASAPALPPIGKLWTGERRGISWNSDVEEARSAASRSGKPLLFFQVVGELDLEGC